MGYLYRATITVNPIKVGASDSANFPMLFSGTYTYLASLANGGQVTNANGYDIIFCSDAQGFNQLNHEIDSYATTGAVNMWVQIPTLSHSTPTVIYMFYGNSAISTSQQNINATWDANYKAVYHFGTASSLVLTDSTSNGFTLTNNNDLAAAAAEVNGGANSTTTTAWASNAALGGFSYTTGDIITVEAWVKRASTGAANYYPIISLVKAASLSTSLRNLELDFNGGAVGEGTVDAITFHVRNSANNAWDSFVHNAADTDTTSFHHYAFTYTYGTGSSAIMYKDGVALTAAWVTNGNLVPTTNVDTLYINTDNAGGATHAYSLKGISDEIRLSKGIARSADWMLASYNSQSSPSTFYNISLVEALSGTPGTSRSHLTVGDGMSRSDVAN